MSDCRCVWSASSSNRSDFSCASSALNLSLSECRCSASRRPWAPSASAASAFCCAALTSAFRRSISDWAPLNCRAQPTAGPTAHQMGGGRLGDWVPTSQTVAQEHACTATAGFWMGAAISAMASVLQMPWQNLVHFAVPHVAYSLTPTPAGTRPSAHRPAPRPAHNATLQACPTAHRQ